MSAKKRIFISSVQKELELERAAVASLVATDPFLLQHCVPVLFEKEPPAARPAPKGYLETLHGCALYVLIIAHEYGQLDGELSATHHEYRLAQKLKLPTIVFLKGAQDEARNAEAKAFFAETKKDGYKYVRFHDREDLKPAMLEALRCALADVFGLKATSADVSESEQLIDAASTFESTVLANVSVESLDQALLDRFNQQTVSGDPERIWRSPAEALQTRGLAVPGQEKNTFRATAAALLLFGPSPAFRFPQCEILADAYDETRVSGRPKGQVTINAPLAHVLDHALKFIDDHTFHPRRVVGLNNLRLDEYPVAALREALVNAVAHRSYDDAARKIFVRVFSDRVEISSPGYPPKPLTLAKLRRGGYKPCSRNPLIAQTLATLGVMEQRGSGFARMQDAMLNHGLEVPLFGQQDGFFIVTLPGPAGNYDRLILPAGVSGPITAAVEEQLNKRQRAILLHAQKSGAVTSGWCRKRFDVAYQTVNRDLGALVDLNLIQAVGRGRSTRYVLRSAGD